MRTLITVVFLLSCSISYAQKHLQITYENISYNFSNVISSEIKVIATQKSCLSITEDKWGGQKVVVDKSTGAYSIEDNHEIRTYKLFKDYQRNVLQYYESFPNSFVEESLNRFRWQLVDSTRTILGYNCRKAKTHYRGRDYEAWFTTDLPFKAAPWKIHGLPGVILEVKTLDDYIHITALELKITTGKEPINPFSKKKFITWDSFVELHKSEIKKMQSKMAAGNAKANILDSKYSYSNPRIEIIVECNRLNSHKRNLWDQKRDLISKGKNKTR